MVSSPKNSTHSQWSGLQNIEHMDSQLYMRRSVLSSPLLRLVMFRARSVACCQTVSFLLSTCLLTGLAMPHIPLSHPCLGREMAGSLCHYWPGEMSITRVGGLRLGRAGLTAGGVVIRQF